MKRDMDLIRTILLEIEQYPKPRGVVKIEAHGYSPAQISYHVKILNQAGLIEARDHTDLDKDNWVPIALTWRGHEFLDSTRNETIWQKVQAEVKDRGLSLPFKLIEELAIKIAADYMKL